MTGKEADMLAWFRRLRAAIAAYFDRVEAAWDMVGQEPQDGPK